MQYEPTLTAVSIQKAMTFDSNRASIHAINSYWKLSAHWCLKSCYCSWIGCQTFSWSQMAYKWNERINTKENWPSRLWSMPNYSSSDFPLLNGHFMHLCPGLNASICLISASYLALLPNIFILLRTMCGLVTFYQWGHFVMLITRN